MRMWHLRTVAWVVATVFGAHALSYAQSPTPPAARSQEPRLERPAELVSLVDEAYRCPPEWRADALIRLAARAREVDRAWAKQLLEDAFAAAPGAQYHTPLDTSCLVAADSDPHVTVAMQQWQVDSLSLECRAVRAMIAVDRKRALELFNTIEPGVSVGPAECDRLLVPRVGIYFDTLFEVAKSCFDRAARKRGDDIPLVARRISQLESSADAGPALVALAKADVGADRLSDFVAALKTGLEGSAPDSAAFRLACSNDYLIENYAALRQQCAAAKVSDAALVVAFRAFVVQNLAAPRCVFLGHEPSPSEDSKILSAYHGAAPAGHPLYPPEGVPERVDTVADPAPFWYGSPPSFDVLLAVGKLNDGRWADAAARESPEWKAAWAEALSKLEAWPSTDETSEASYFQKKSRMYAYLVERTPEGPQRDGLLLEYLAFVQSSPLERAAPTDWFASLDYLLGLIDAKRLDGRQRLLAAMLGSKAPVIRLYARLAASHP